MYVEKTSVMLVILPRESTVITGFLPPVPYVAGAVEPAMFDRFPPYP